ncbi:MAG: glycosyltransferase [Microthrixaceae bacterium]
MNVTILSSARWSSFWVSKQLVARALAGLDHSVLYVDPPVSPLSLIRQPGRVHDLMGPRDEQHGDVRVWRPRVIPGQNSSLGQRINAALLMRGLHQRMREVDLAVAFSLESRGAFAHVGGRRVYYCTDSLEDLPGADAAAHRTRELELASLADLTVACSLPLVDQLRSRGVDAVYLPHAADPLPARADAPLPDALRGAPRPLLGYVGSLNFRLDVDLLRAATRCGTLVVIGGAFGPKPTDAVADLLASERVVLTGHQPPEVLPQWLAHLDVGLIPYTGSPFNRKSFPIKLLQYLAAGLPVVSTPNGATDEHGSLVHVASDPAGYEAAIGRALAEDQPALRAQRRSAATARTWTDVAQALVELSSADRR